MPELPEVETARRLVERASRGRRITAVFTAPDRLVFDGVREAVLRAALVGATVVGSARRGKHFWLELDRRPFPCFHLGMTGGFHFYRGETGRPRFLVLELELEHGLRIGYSDPRRLGRIRLREDPPGEAPIAALGFDPVLDLPGVAAFAALVRARRRPIKALLLDQGFAAGVGNWIADEVLFQARVAPTRSAHGLSDAEIARLRRALGRIVGHAVSVSADDARFPRSWLFHVRWGRKPGARCQGHPVQFTTVGGRTTAWVPALQH